MKLPKETLDKKKIIVGLKIKMIWYYSKIPVNNIFFVIDCVKQLKPNNRMYLSIFDTFFN